MKTSNTSEPLDFDLEALCQDVRSFYPDRVRKVIEISSIPLDSIDNAKKVVLFLGEDTSAMKSEANKVWRELCEKELTAAETIEAVEKAVERFPEYANNLHEQANKKKLNLLSTFPELIDFMKKGGLSRNLKEAVFSKLLRSISTYEEARTLAGLCHPDDTHLLRHIDSKAYAIIKPQIDAAESMEEYLAAYKLLVPLNFCNDARPRRQWVVFYLVSLCESDEELIALQAKLHDDDKKTASRKRQEKEVSRVKDKTDLNELFVLAQSDLCEMSDEAKKRFSVVYKERLETLSSLDSALSFFSIWSRHINIEGALEDKLLSFLLDFDSGKKIASHFNATPVVFPTNEKAEQFITKWLAFAKTTEEAAVIAVVYVEKKSELRPMLRWAELVQNFDEAVRFYESCNTEETRKIGVEVLLKNIKTPFEIMALLGRSERLRTNAIHPLVPHLLKKGLELVSTKTEANLLLRSIEWGGFDAHVAVIQGMKRFYPLKPVESKK